MPVITRLKPSSFFVRPRLLQTCGNCAVGERKMTSTFARNIILLFFIVVLVMPQTVLAVHATNNDYQGDGTPKVANFYFKWEIESDAIAKELAQRDLLILDITNESTSRERMKMIKEINPNIIILAYISSMDIRPDAADMQEGFPRTYLGKEIQENPGWILKKPDGNGAHWWEDYTLLNVTNNASQDSDGQRWNDYFPAFVRDAVIADPIWDGVFYDNLWEGVSFIGPVDLNNDGVDDDDDWANRQWRQGLKKILKQTRKYAKQLKRPHFIITGNSGTGYYNYLNGVGFEHFPSTSYGKWVWTMRNYDFILSHARPEQLAITNTNVKNTGNKTNYRKFRYGLMSTLLNDGYYSFDNGDQSHTEIWNYDEYNSVLGQAISGSYNLLKPQDSTTRRRGLWRRDYAQAIVLVNSTKKKKIIDLRTGFEKIKGTQDPKVNSGNVIGHITIPKRDGIILLRRLTEITDATFINGAYAKIFDSSGKELRKSFFSSDGRFTGGVQVHRLSSLNRTVVADQTRVRVYDQKNNEIANFAPYGNNFTDGVNIAVGPLYGGKKNYIVTGRQSGTPLVRIYDLKGNLRNFGCFPFAKNSSTGVNVAIGDLNGDKRSEIIVAPGHGGGPRVLILNNYCETISPGFFAFPQEWRLGLNITAGDVNGDGKDEIIAALGPGGFSQVRIFNKKGKLLSPGFLAYGPSDRSGVLLSTVDINQDGQDDIVTSSFSIFNPF
ncbi:MAG: hypothetical protein A2233_05235 [Candidatus Kerfeldbacteria bacterium RIFOXYA2_FULL_38_24]|nr:MAG: hypothetical protein A2233_05235 [Candidatus Kerfeldbacteria bacterium RIFOXYA2_FULL_38_24]